MTRRCQRVTKSITVAPNFILWRNACDVIRRSYVSLAAETIGKEGEGIGGSGEEERKGMVNVLRAPMGALAVDQASWQRSTKV